MKSVILNVRNASTAAHSAVILVMIGVGLYNTSPSYHADVLAAWAHTPHWLRALAELVIPPAVIYWNSKKAEAAAGK